MPEPCADIIGYPVSQAAATCQATHFIATGVSGVTKWFKKSMQDGKLHQHFKCDVMDGFKGKGIDEHFCKKICASSGDVYDSQHHYCNTHDKFTSSDGQHQTCICKKGYHDASLTHGKCENASTGDKYDCSLYNSGNGRLSSAGAEKGCMADGACKWVPNSQNSSQGAAPATPASPSKVVCQNFKDMKSCMSHHPPCYFDRHKCIHFVPHAKGPDPRGHKPVHDSSDAHFFQAPRLVDPRHP
eukprot:385634-Prymnesium_polylepis.1